MQSHELHHFGGTFYVTQRNDDSTYDLYQVRLDHIANFRRKWQAVEAARSHAGVEGPHL